jgi:23S rRNA (adenine2030-N6)-methyltransferase
MAYSICPPTPRRGALLVDPSYEVKDDYDVLPRHLSKIARAWPVGVLMLWYPVLTDNRHRPMVRALNAGLPDVLIHEVSFPLARDGHRMVGSGLAIVNAPWGLDAELTTLAGKFAQL